MKVPTIFSAQVQNRGRPDTVTLPIRVMEPTEVLSKQKAYISVFTFIVASLPKPFSIGLASGVQSTQRH